MLMDQRMATKDPRRPSQILRLLSYFKFWLPLRWAEQLRLMLNAVKRNVFKFVFRLFVLVYSQVYAWPCFLRGSLHLENNTDLELPISIFSVRIRKIIQI
jgi:hypothetical protein